MGYVYLVQLSNIIAITAILVRVDLYVYIKLLLLFFPLWFDSLIP